MSKKLAIITGGNRGLGEALVKKLSFLEFDIISISRKETDEQKSNPKFTFLKIDLSKSTEFNELDGISFDKYESVVFISNAFVIEPIEKVGKLEKEKVELALKINTISPVLLTNKIISLIKKNKLDLKIINISSGAARGSIDGWSIYCASKAFNEHFFNTLAKESGLEIYNIDPGVIDTGMQSQIRSKSDSEMPDVNNFRELNLKTPQETAEEVLAKAHIS